MNSETEKKSTKAALLWQEYQSGHSTATREKLLLNYLPMVKYVAGRMMISLPSCVEYEDLVSAGTLGLIGALERFDPEHGVKFETYVLPRIKGAILDELRTMDWVPRSLRSKARNVETVTADLERNLGRSATAYEISEKLNIEVSQYSVLMQQIHSASLLSLDSCAPEDQDIHGNMYDVIEDPRANNPVSNIEKEEMKKVLVKLIDCLPEQEKLVIALYYFEELTLKEIGQVISITESRVSQIHTKAIAFLKTKIVSEFIR